MGVSSWSSRRRQVMIRWLTGDTTMQTGTRSERCCIRTPTHTVIRRRYPQPDNVVLPATSGDGGTITRDPVQGEVRPTPSTCHPRSARHVDPHHPEVLFSCHRGAFSLQLSHPLLVTQNTLCPSLLHSRQWLRRWADHVVALALNLSLFVAGVIIQNRHQHTHINWLIHTHPLDYSNFGTCRPQLGTCLFPPFPRYPLIPPP